MARDGKTMTHSDYAYRRKQRASTVIFLLVPQPGILQVRLPVFVHGACCNEHTAQARIEIRLRWAIAGCRGVMRRTYSFFSAIMVFVVSIFVGV